MPDASSLPPVVSVMPKLTHAMLFSSPLNPRKSFVEAELQELAASVAKHGVLQNLIARTHPKKPHAYEIVAGERRWRAVGMAIKAGTWPEDRALPVVVRELSDLEALKIATAENVQRSNLTPMEEAHAFKKLVDEKLATAEIAKLIDKTQRYVQQRLDLLDRLDAVAQEALTKGQISVTAARALTQAPKAKQEQILKQMIPGKSGEAHLESEREILEAVRETLVPVSRAKFDLKLYKGELRPHPDNAKIECFDDVAQFERLQKAWLNATKAALEKKWKWVKVEHEWRPQQLPYPFQKDAKRSDAGALIVIGADGAHEGEVFIYEGVYDSNKSDRSQAIRSAPSSPRRESFDSSAFHVHCRDTKTAAFRGALLGDEAMALRLLALNVASSLGNYYRADGTASVIVRNGQSGLDEPAEDAAGAAAAKLIGAHVEAKNLWPALLKMEKPALVGLLAKLSAACAVIQNEPGVFSADRPIDVKVAREAGTDVAKAWSWEKDGPAFLRKAGRKQLYWLCRDLGIKVKSEAEPKEMRPLLLKVKPPAGYVPPWLQIFTRAETEKALASVKPTIAKPKLQLSPGAEFKQKKVKAKRAAKAAAKKIAKPKAVKKGGRK